MTHLMKSVEKSLPEQRPARVLILILGLGAVLTMGVYLVLFAFHRQPQLLIEPAAIIIALILLAVALRLRAAGRQILAGCLLLLGITLALSGNGMAVSGVTWPVLGGGLLIISLAAWIVIPNRLGFALPVILLYVIILLYAELRSPLVRFEVSQSPFLQWYILGWTAAMVLLAGGLIASRINNSTIRTRLMVSFILVALLPTAVTGLVVSLRAVQNQEDRLVNQLESVASLKEAEIGTWVESLDASLSTLLSQEERSLAETLLNASPAPQEAGGELRRRINPRVSRAQLFDEIFIMDLDGRAIFSTDPHQEGKRYTGQSMVVMGQKEHYLTRPIYSPALSSYRVIAVQPIQDASGNTTGILAGRASMARLDSIMLERAGLGVTGETYLVGANQVLVTSLRSGQRYLIMKTVGANQAIHSGGQGSGIYENTFGVPVIGVYHWVPSLQVALLAEQSREEALAPVVYTVGITAVIVIASLLTTIGLSLLLTRSISRPLAELVSLSGEIASGNLTLQAKTGRDDELGALGRAFNTMAAQLNGLITGLEQRVVERTVELERRSTQIQVASEIARDIAGSASLDNLLSDSVELVRQRFGFYHAGIFLLDEVGEYAVLRAATGLAGQEMIARGHRLQVGAAGIVGSATGSGQAHVSLDVDADHAHYKNPLLPETRSEVAFPLIAGGKVIGALDVQSTLPDAFDEQDITILQTMADQLAIAIENARLIERLNETVCELEQAYGRYTQEAWTGFTRDMLAEKGYRYKHAHLEAASEQNLEAQQAMLSGQAVHIRIAATSEEGGAGSDTMQPRSGLAVPILLRGQAIGALNLRCPGDHVPEETAALAEEAAARLALLLENARLLREAQRTALREQQINQLAASMRASVDVETILQTTVRELCRTVGASRAFIQLGLASSSEPVTSLEHSEDRLPYQGSSGASQDTFFKTELLSYEYDGLRLISLRPDQSRRLPAKARERLALGETFIHISTTNGASRPGSILLVPIRRYEALVGVIGLEETNPQYVWPADVIAIAEAVAIQAAQTLENARLYQETQELANRERLIAEISGNMQRAANVEDLLTGTLRDLQASLGAAYAAVRLNTELIGADFTAGDSSSADSQTPIG